MKVARDHLRHFLSPYLSSRNLPAAAIQIASGGKTIETLMLPFLPRSGALPLDWQEKLLPSELCSLRSNAICLPSPIFWCALLSFIGVRAGFDSVEVKNTLRVFAVWQTGSSAYPAVPFLHSCSSLFQFVLSLLCLLKMTSAPDCRRGSNGRGRYFARLCPCCRLIIVCIAFARHRCRRCQCAEAQARARQRADP
jgi:hypothetical protein